VLGKICVHEGSHLGELATVGSDTAFFVVVGQNKGSEHEGM
jgi:hypothetical protein